MTTKITTTPTPLAVVGTINSIIDDTTNLSTTVGNKLDKTSLVNMTGATASADGKAGLVPAPSAGDNTKFLRGDGTWQAVQTIINFIYPIGSLYWSKNSTNPGTLFGGTWAQIKDKFILAAGDTYAQGAAGGAATVTLTTGQMPSHTHSGSATSSSAGHTHTVSITAYSSGGETSGYYLSSGSGADSSRTFTTSSSGGSHSHTISLNNTGSGQAHNNMPPYVVYYCWERTA